MESVHESEQLVTVCLDKSEQGQLPLVVTLQGEFQVMFTVTNGSEMQISRCIIRIETSPRTNLRVTSAKDGWDPRFEPNSHYSGKVVKGRINGIGLQPGLSIDPNKSRKGSCGVNIENFMGVPHRNLNVDSISGKIFPVTISLTAEYQYADGVEHQTDCRSSDPILVHCPEGLMQRILHVVRYDPLVFLTAVAVAMGLNWLLPNPFETFALIWEKIQLLLVALAS